MAEPTEYQTSAGKRYRVQYRKPDGSPTSKRGFKTKRDANLFLSTVAVKKATGTYFDPQAAKITIGELGDDWLRNKKKALKPSAYAPLETSWRVYVQPRWGTTQIGVVRPSAVETWIRELGEGVAKTNRVRTGLNGKPRSASVVLRAVGVLAGILDGAVRDERIPKNPARGASNLPRKKSQKPRRYLTHEQVWRLADAAPDATRKTLLLTLAYTGIRWGEAVALRVRDVNIVRRRLSIDRTATEVEGVIHTGPPKSWEKRTVPFPVALRRLLEEQSRDKGPDDLVFPGRHGGFLMRPDTSEGRSSWFLTALAKARLERLTPHDLKHTAASLAVSAGANVKVLQRMLGHKSAALTLDIYADLFDDDLDGVAAALDAQIDAAVPMRM